MNLGDLLSGRILSQNSLGRISGREGEEKNRMRIRRGDDVWFTHTKKDLLSHRSKILFYVRWSKIEMHCTSTFLIHVSFFSA